MNRKEKEKNRDLICVDQQIEAKKEAPQKNIPSEKAIFVKNRFY
ncbi:MAG: hypothetical protein ACK5ND_00585 [Bacteroides sp.]